MKLPEVIGIAGTNGSGKDTLAALRAERENCLHVTVSDILRAHLTEEGVALEREYLAALSKRWREESGDEAILVTKTIQRYLGERALVGHNGLSVVSLRHPAEVIAVKKFGGKVLWVDADPEIRYERICGAQRNRVDDDKTFEQFRAEEAREMTPAHGDSTSVNLGAVRPLADEIVINNFATREAYVDYLASTFEIA
ncbi:MAG: AAA family ATPase [Candidatus Saccharibacteria bacterium]